MPIDTYIIRLLEREGPFSHTAVDKGGPTKFGITQSTLSFVRGVPCTIEDVKALSQAEAVQIYKKLYFTNHRLAMLPDEIEEQLFDFGVNSGPWIAIQALQECLGVKVDGVIGPKTIAASILACRPDGGRKLNIQLAKWRCMMLARICRRDPSQIAFLGGWLRRSLEFAT